MATQIESEFLGHKIAVRYTPSNGLTLSIDGNIVDTGKRLANRLAVLHGTVMEHGNTHSIEVMLSGWWSGNLVLFIDGEEIARSKL